MMTRRFLKPGEFCIATAPAILETLVGSCVAVCLYNFKNGHAAMNHFLRDKPLREDNTEIGEFGSTSTEHIIKRLMAVDGSPAHYRAMIFGGAAVVKTSSGNSDIGRKNVEVATNVLANAHIPVTHTEVGGRRGRRVTFDAGTGTAQCRFAGDIRKKRKE